MVAFDNTIPSLLIFPDADRVASATEALAESAGSKQATNEDEPPEESTSH